MIMGMIAVVIGILMIILGIRSFIKDFKAKGYSGMADAVVVKVEEERRGTAKTGFYTEFVPTITYVAAGQEYTDAYRGGRGGNGYQPGQKVRVRYDQARPEHYIIEGDNNAKGNGTILLLIGFVAAYLGVSEILRIQCGIDLRFWLNR